MIKNIIFDFDGVLVDSEVLVARALSKYLSKRGIKFEEREFSKFAGNKTVEIVSKLSLLFNIKDKEVFFNDLMSLSKDLYVNKLEPINGLNVFLNKVNHKKLIGSNNIKERIIEGLIKIGIKKFFNSELIFSFDIVGVPKPKPDIYLKAVEDSGIKIHETIIIEDSAIGTIAGAKSGIKVIGLTAGSHWYSNRSEQELYEAGAYAVVKNYEDMLLLINKL